MGAIPLLNPKAQQKGMRDIREGALVYAGPLQLVGWKMQRDKGLPSAAASTLHVPCLARTTGTKSYPCNPSTTQKPFAELHSTHPLLHYLTTLAWSSLAPSGSLLLGRKDTNLMVHQAPVAPPFTERLWWIISALYKVAGGTTATASRRKGLPHLCWGDVADVLWCQLFQECGLACIIQSQEEDSHLLVWGAF